MLPLSPSSIADYQECPHKYRLRHVEHVPEPPTLDTDLVRGSAGHAAMESFYMAEPAQRSEQLLLTNFELAIGDLTSHYEQQAGELPPWALDNVQRAHLQGAKALQLFWQVFGNEPDVPALPGEQRYERRLANGIELHGIIDAVWVQPTRVTLLEFKFPYSVPALNQYLVDSMQHNYYALMLLELQLPTYIRYTICSQNRAARPDDVLVGYEALWEADSTLVDVSTAIATHLYPRHRSFYCARCPFHTSCLLSVTGGAPL